MFKPYNLLSTNYTEILYYPAFPDTQSLRFMNNHNPDDPDSLVNKLLLLNSKIPKNTKSNQFHETVDELLDPDFYYFSITENVYVGPDGLTSLLGVKGFVKTNEDCQRLSIPNDNELVFKGVHDFCIGIAHINNVLDAFLLLTLIPEKAFKRGKVLLRSSVYDTLLFDVLDINNTNIIFVESNEYVFARHYLTTDPMVCQNVNNKEILKKARIRIAKKYNLDKEKPFRYLVIAKEETTLRREFENIKNRLPTQNWELYEEKKTIAESARYINQALLVITYCDKTLMNCIVMQHYTVLCAIESHFSQDFIQFFTYSLRLSLVLIETTTIDNIAVAVLQGISRLKEDEMIPK